MTERRPDRELPQEAGDGEEQTGAPADLLGQLLSGVLGGAGGGPEGSPGPLGAMGGLGDILAQAQSIQHQLIEAQEAAAGQELEGSAGGGAVRIRVNGAMEFLSVRIDPSAVDPDDLGLLEDLVLAALHDATDRVRELNERLMGGAG